MRRTLALLVVLVAAAIASQTASAAPHVCNGTLSHVTLSGGIVVPALGHCFLDHVTFSGGLTANGADRLIVVDSQGSGPVVVTNTPTVGVARSFLSGGQVFAGISDFGLGDNTLVGGLTCVVLAAPGFYDVFRNTISGGGHCINTYTDPPGTNAVDGSRRPGCVHMRPAAGV